jgi:manganese/zinc/iron transport system permease protein
MTYNTLIVLLGVGLLGAGAGLVGSFAVLRRRALLGDALAHAALPGLCLGFLAFGERNLLAMLAGALVTGLLGIGVVTGLRRYTRVREDAAIGIVLSVFFGCGIVLTRLIQNASSFAGSKAGLDSYILGKTAGMIASDVMLIAGVAAFSLGLILALFKEFLLVGFDADFASVQGWPVLAIDVLLTSLIAVTVVIGLPAVGVVMITALLIVPGVTARFWSDRLSFVLAIAVAIGMLMGVIGTAISATYAKMPAGPVITLVGTAFFVASALVAPKRGLISRRLTTAQDRRAAAYRRFLMSIYELPEHALDQEAVRLRGDASHVQHGLRTGDLVQRTSETVALSESGQNRARDVIRNVALWKLFVAHYPDLVTQAQPFSPQPIEDILEPHIVSDLHARLAEGTP